MRTKLFLPMTFLIIIALAACINQNGYDEELELYQTAFEQTVEFEKTLSAYNIFDGEAFELIPNSDFHLLELSSPLFTDYAHKQRLVKVPVGTKIEKGMDENLDFPNGTILVKTFFYYQDERNINSGKNIIESRLLIKQDSKWNAATYIWNENQSDALLDYNGAEMDVSWIDNSGINLSTRYQIPSQNDCGTCHQSNSKLTPLGPNLRNLNREVERNQMKINQITHLQEMGVLNDFPVGSISQIVNYTDSTISLDLRARAYLAMNCAHCHNPSGWEKSGQRRFDFSYETPLSQSGISSKKDQILRNMENGRMPFIGTSMKDEEGIELIKDYLNGL